MADSKKEPETKKMGKGRPRKYADEAERVQAFRRRKKADGRRIDAYINTKASYRLTVLSKAWDCSIGEVIERLLMESDERYGDIFHPDNYVSGNDISTTRRK
jgi:hypothetical protein